MSAASQSEALRRTDALVKALPSGIAKRHDPLEIEGATPTLTVRPEDGESLAATVCALAEVGASALLRGGGSRLHTANAPARADVLLELGGLAAEPLLDLDEGVAWLPAGLPIAQVSERLAGSGWELPLDPPGPASTVGGALAAAASGPRFPHPRDITLGLDVTLGSGERTRCGGRVVKNVSGYDLVKLYLGSFGTLAVIEAAWIRLRPTPEQIWVGQASSEGQSGALALDAARSASARVAALVDPPGGGPAALVVELAGDAPAVERDRRRLESSMDLTAAPAGAVDALRTLQGSSQGIRLRIDGLPSAAHTLAASLRAVGARILCFPARGLVYAISNLRDEAAADRLLRAARAASDQHPTGTRIEAGPLALRTGREVFGADSSQVPLHRALKRQYDPSGVLNPGRFLGGL